MLAPWRPRTLNRAQQEERRLHAQRLLEARQNGTTDIAQALGVAESTVRGWTKKLRDGGEHALRATVSTGRPHRLTTDDLAQLPALLQQGGLAHWYPDDRWTRRRVREVIGTTFGVWYHVDHVGALLHDLGLSSQRPETRAMERDEAVIRAWVETIRPELAKEIALGTTVLFADEVGFSLKTSVVRTWAPVGQTPLIHTRACWDKLSMIEGITSGGQLLQLTRAGAITAVQVIAFLEHVLVHVVGDVVVVLDNAGIHKAKAVKTFVEEQPRLSLVFPPPYAPELNPVERVWAYVKRHVLGNVCLRNVAELKGHLRRAWRTVRRKKLASALLSDLIPLRKP